MHKNKARNMFMYKSTQELTNGMARKPLTGRDSYIYWNLHKKCWSIKGYAKPKALGGGYQKVEHKTSLCLMHCEFPVSANARERVLESRSKVVHAFVKGRIVPLEVFQARYRSYPAAPRITRISYNPYKAGFFFDCVSGQEVVRAEMVMMLPSGRVLAVGPVYGEGKAW